MNKTRPNDILFLKTELKHKLSHLMLFSKKHLGINLDAIKKENFMQTGVLFKNIDETFPTNKNKLIRFNWGDNDDY